MQEVIEVMKFCVNYQGNDTEFISALRMAIVTYLDDNITMFDTSQVNQYTEQQLVVIKNAKDYYISNHLPSIVHYLSALSQKNIYMQNPELFMETIS